MELDELLLECFDALRLSLWDCNERGVHLEQIADTLSKGDTSDADRILLLSAAEQFRKHGHVSPSVRVMQDRGEELELAAAIEQRLGPGRYVFHGTVQGRLNGIAKDGLVPGRFKTWSEEEVPKEFLDSAIFFTKTWRGAMNFAENAHLRSRGPRAGKFRTPIVVRLPATGLKLQPDPLSNFPDCLMAKGPIFAEKADVLVGAIRGFPRWIPLSEALSEKNF